MLVGALIGGAIRSTRRVQRYNIRSVSDVVRRWESSTRETELPWDADSQSLKAGRAKSLLSLLEERGFVKDIAGYAHNDVL